MERINNNLQAEIGDLKAKLEEYEMRKPKPNPGRMQYDRYQLGLLSRLANQIGNEGTLFYEINAQIKDANYQTDEIANLRVQIAVANASIADLKAKVAEAEKRAVIVYIRHSDEIHRHWLSYAGKLNFGEFALEYLRAEIEKVKP